MPPKGKDDRRINKRVREPLKGQRGIKSFFGTVGGNATAPGSTPTSQRKVSQPGMVTSATFIDLSDGCSSQSVAPSMVTHTRRTALAAPSGGSSDHSCGSCPDITVSTVEADSPRPAARCSRPTGGVRFVRASELVDKRQLQRGGVTHTASMGEVPTLASAVPAAAAGDGAGNVVDARCASSRGSLGLCSSGRAPRVLKSWRQRSDPIVLPLHVVGLLFRDVPSSDVHPDNTTGCNNTAIGPDTALVLEREPSNSYDQNAIKVLHPASSLGLRFLGYIPARVAALLAPILDAASGSAVARVTLKTRREEDDAASARGGGLGPRTLPAVLEVRPLTGADQEPFVRSFAKLRVAAKKEEKRQQKGQREARANMKRLRSKQKSLLLDFGRSRPRNGPPAMADCGGTSRGGGMLENMPREVLWEIFCSPGISSRELFGPIRAVCQNWLQAVDALPCASARKMVARACAGQVIDYAALPSPREDAGKGKALGHSKRGGGDLKESVEGRGSQGSAASRTVSCDSGIVPLSTWKGKYGWTGSGSSSKATWDNVLRCDWWSTVRSRLVRGSGFTECDAGDVLRRLEWGAELEEDGTPVMAKGVRNRSNDTGGESSCVDDDGESGAAAADGQEENDFFGPRTESRSRRSRVLGHIAATRVLCAEWGVAVGDGAAKDGGRDFADGCSGGSGKAGDGVRTTSGSWSGWEAFALAVVTSSSRDRLSLCCWAIKPLMGGGSRGGGVEGGDMLCPGLPRREVIELLCVILCALRALEIEEGPWAGLAEGTFRLKGDLLVCARMLENWDVRFMRPGQPGGGVGRIVSGGGGASGLLSSLTSEQRSIVLTDVKPGEVLAVLAFAGTGKTTCLRAYAHARPHLRILYLTFNVSVRKEAEKTFPPNVDCKGVHQLAFRHVGRRYHRKLAQELRETDVQAFLKRSLGKEVQPSQVSQVLVTLSSFLASASPELILAHSKPPTAMAVGPTLLSCDSCGISSEDEQDGRTVVAQSWPPSVRSSDVQPHPSCSLTNHTALAWAKRVWAAMQAPDSDSGVDSLDMTHAGYLKLFQLGRKLLGRSYDVIMLDEAQDSNPCIANIVLRETGCARIMVGDSHQAIYGFIGAEDHLRSVKGGKVRHLTQVFRFGESIAHVANTLVGILKDETRPLLGCPGISSEVDRDQWGTWVNTHSRVKQPYAFLSRTVSSLVEAATLLMREGKKLAWVSGAQAYNLEFFEDMCLIALDRPQDVRHPLLKKLKTTKALARYIQDCGDRGWHHRLMMLQSSDPSVLLSELRELQRKQVSPSQADVILSTVHKAKGLEFDTVVLADDFVGVHYDAWTSKAVSPGMLLTDPDQEEVNVIYVAVTRAKRKLVLNYALNRFFLFVRSSNSICLRGISSLREYSSFSYFSTPISSQKYHGTESLMRCILCGDVLATFGGGGTRTDRVDKDQAYAMLAGTGSRPPRQRGFPMVRNGVPVGEGLLYAESESLRALCYWCVERGCEDFPVNPARRRFAYAGSLMRGVSKDVT